MPLSWASIGEETRRVVSSSGEQGILEERVHRGVMDAGLVIPGSQDREGWRHLSEFSWVMVNDIANPAQKQERLSTLGQSCVHRSVFVILPCSAPYKCRSSNPYSPRVEVSAGQVLGAKALTGAPMCTGSPPSGSHPERNL